MFKIRAMVTAVVFATAFSAAPAESADSIYGRFSVSTRYSLASAGLDDLNHFFDTFNAGSGIIASNYEAYGDFSGGTGFEADIRYAFTENFVAGVAVGLLNDEVSVSQDWQKDKGGDPIDFSLDRTVKVETVPFLISGYYYVSIMDGVRAYAGGGLGVFGVRLVSDSVHDMDPNGDQGSTYTDDRWGMDPLDSGTRYWNGSDAGVHLTLGGEYSLNNHVVVSADAQYRDVTVRELFDVEENAFVHYEGTDDPDEAAFEFLDADGSTLHYMKSTTVPVEVDLSGVQVNLGVRLYF